MRTLFYLAAAMLLTACTHSVHLNNQSNVSTCGNDCKASINLITDIKNNNKESIEQYDIQHFEFDFYSSIAHQTQLALEENGYSVNTVTSDEVSTLKQANYTVEYLLEDNSMTIPGTVFGESNATASVSFKLYDSDKNLLLSGSESCAFRDEMNGSETTSHFLMPFDSLTATSFKAFLARVWNTAIYECSQSFAGKVDAIHANQLESRDNVSLSKPLN
ncbi:hypothetical protein [Enterovibrio coralii]|uniref:Lipoprotein n=1 Tax=Enterovibrio coralii TaxID=294935 RepID=A0A135I826_9GAMM|nr:hypothetical protein [Enterovibrio coralii]KXF81603.1 hypothetical protein ATN88_02695 [Enterovibrio coralii]